MGRRYKNPPLVEAVCEFRFDPGTPWDLAIPGLVFQEIQELFPKRREVKVLEGTLSAGPGGVQQAVRTQDRVQFLREDERALVHVGPNLLSVNRLKPYATWDEFLPLAEKGLDAYRRVVKPSGLERVGLRYINRIEFGSESVEQEDYLEFRPFVGHQLPQEFGPFIVGIGIPYEDSRDMLRVQLMSAEPSPAQALVAILDLDYFLAQPGKVAVDAVTEWLNIAHDRVEDIFEGCLTDRLRAMFEEVK